LRGQKKETKEKGEAKNEARLRSPSARTRRYGLDRSAMDGYAHSTFVLRSPALHESPGRTSLFARPAQCAGPLCRGLRRGVLPRPFGRTAKAWRCSGTAARDENNLQDLVWSFHLVDAVGHWTKRGQL